MLSDCAISKTRSDWLNYIKPLLLRSENQEAFMFWCRKDFPRPGSSMVIFLFLIFVMSAGCNTSGSQNSGGVFQVGGNEQAEQTLHVFGPELPFMFTTTGDKADFAWSDIMQNGNSGVGTISSGEGEAFGINGTFFVASVDEPTPTPVTDEETLSGVSANFNPENPVPLLGPFDLDSIQTAIDANLSEKESYLYLVYIKGHFSWIEYQLEGPDPANEEVIERIEAGEGRKPSRLARTNTPFMTWTPRLSPSAFLTT